MSTAAATQVLDDASVPQLRPQRLLPKDVGIPIRTLGQTYDEAMPKWWVGNNPFLTAFFATFSATLPEGELQFVYSVRLFQDRITDPVLKAQVRAFVGQEGQHRNEHDAANAEMKRRGLRLDRIEKSVQSMNKMMRERQSPAQQLAGTVCGEHITALMADVALQKYPRLLEMTAEPARQLWAWHAIEETEHKAVAFDVYDQLVGDRKLLRRTMVVATIFFFLLNFYHAFRLLPLKDWFRPKMWWEAFGVIGQLIRRSRKDYMDFYKPDFHPWQHDNKEAVKAAKLKYLGEAA
ncbi:metal-dependent hydrolase [Oleomonas cavernae]|uniref:Metal-dependent hydrolase n=1 Tax=Oleomonas cavernae TaxID=2320859 RepID=A0A418WH52_9PROT|nr:metal-dependent hydrolase [Oleomonas cavernae]RJF89320.1 metal-dependent hydrolase [Oleomonas cavernae]